MNRLILAGVVLQLAALPALAQTAPQTPAQTPAPVVAASPAATPAVTSPSAPAQVSTTGTPGANSFTAGEAKARLERNGYSDVKELAKDSSGIWRGKATKGSSQVAVGVDYKGTIITE